MRRALGMLMIAGLLFGTAACGSSGGSDSSSGDDTEATADGGGETTDSGNADVKAYCDAVDDYVQQIEDASGDAAKLADLTDEGQELAEKAAALGTADLNADEVQEVADCTKKSTEALMPG